MPNARDNALQRVYQVRGAGAEQQDAVGSSHTATPAKPAEAGFPPPRQSLIAAIGAAPFRGLCTCSRG
jgi:hypothetical protein